MPNRPHRIFIVDDEELIASTLGLILRHEGFEVSSFTSPVEALEAIQTSTPDLLITDVVMLPFSGLRLAIRSREISPQCRILLFSGNPLSAQLIQEASAEGYDFEILVKPMLPNELIEKIRTMLRPEAVLV